MLKTFLTSKLGLVMLGLLFSGLLAGGQQLRVQHYQKAELAALVKVGEFKTALHIKETEAVDLAASIDSQNNKIKQLTLSARADSQRRANSVLHVRFDHQKDLHNIPTVKAGPEAMNKWLTDYF